MIGPLTKGHPNGYEIVFADVTVPATIICWDKPGDRPVVAYIAAGVGGYGPGSLFTCDAEGRSPSGLLCIRNARAAVRETPGQLYARARIREAEAEALDREAAAPHHRRRRAMTDDDFLNFIVPWSMVGGQASTAVALWFLANEGAAMAGWCALGGALYAGVRTWQIRRAVRRRMNGGA